MSLSVRGKLPDVQITIQILTFRKRLRIAELAHVPSVLVENDHQMWLPKRPHGNFAFGQGRDGNRGLHGNRTNQCAVGRENLDKVRATVRHVDLSVGSAVAVLPKSDQWAACLGPGIGSGKFADGENLLALRVEHQQAGRRRSQNVQPPIRPPLHRAQPGAYAREYPLSGGKIVLVLSRYAPSRARQQTHHRKNSHDWAHPLSHDS